VGLGLIHPLTPIELPNYLMISLSASLASSPITSYQRDHTLDINYLCEMIGKQIVESVALTESIPDFIPSAESLQFEINEPSSFQLPLTIDQVRKLSLYLYQICQLEYECLISTFLYLQKLPHLTSGAYRLTRSNWRITLLLCYLISSKMLDDFTMENKDFSIAFQLLTLRQLNSFEIKFVELMKFNLWLSMEEYQQCHDELLFKQNQPHQGTDLPLSGSTRPLIVSSTQEAQTEPATARTPSPPTSSHSSKTNLEVQIRSKGDSFLNQQIVSPHSIAFSSFQSPTSSPLFGSLRHMELLSLTLRTSFTLSDMILSCFEKRVELPSPAPCRDCK
jgi:hypothetical protein